MKKAPLLLSLMSFLLFFSLLIRVKNFKSKPLFVQGALLLCLLLLFFSFSQPPFGLPNQFTYQHQAFSDTEGLSSLQFISVSGSASSPLDCFSQQCDLFQGANLSVPNVMPGSVFILLLNVVCFHSEVLSGLLSTRRYIQYSGQRETQWTLHRVLSNTVHRIYAQNEKEEGH